MKRIWHHPEEPETGKRYWRSLGEVAGTPQFREFLEREFPQGAAEMAGVGEAEETRRSFLKLMGAATSLAGFGMAGCRRPEALLVPYSKAVEWIIPGKPLLYATAMPRPGGCSPLVVTTHEGRPTHVAGNRLHPSNGNGNDGFAQASVLDLYDPERSKAFRRGGEVVARGAFEAAFSELKSKLAGNGEAGLAFLVGESTSPTRARLVAGVKEKFPQAGFYRYEAFNHDAARAAARAGFGDGVMLVPRLEKAKRVLALDCDFLGLDRVATNPVGDFMKGRQVDGGLAGEMNRLYAVEANFTLTGGAADHRLPLRPSQVAAAAALVAAEVGAETGGLQASGAALTPAQESWLKLAAADLAASKGEALVLAGAQQPAVVHALAAAINVALGAPGQTLDVLQGPPDELGSLSDLIDAIAAKRVETLVITTEGDPVYDAPADLLWPAAQRDVANVIHLGVRHLTATARAANWHVPGAHYLESWGDVRATDGTYSVVQPMILPLYGGMSEIDLLLAFLSDPPAPEPVAAAPAPATAEPGTAAAPAPAPGATAAPAPDAAAAPAAAVPAPAAEPPSPAYEAVRATFAGIAGGDDLEAAWNLTLRDGFLSGSAYPPAQAGFQPGAVAGLATPEEGGGASRRMPFEIAFRPDSKVWDGRYINNAWQQEAPDPVTKLTWDNAALVSLRSARALGVERDGQMVRVSVGDRIAYFPVIQAPGHADWVVTIPLGYGQPDVGKVGSGTGFDANPLRHSASPYLTAGASVTLLTDAATVGDATVPAFYTLATTAEHQNMYGRSLVREGTAERLAAQPGFARTEGMDSHIPPNISLYKPTYATGPDKGQPLPRNEAGVLVDDPVHQWGMTIDLNQCIGCNACLLACQSENSIPVVGKEQVLVHREMHWIRMDRYFATAHPDLDRQTQDTDATNAWRGTVEGDHGQEVDTADHFANPEMVFQPVACQQCELAPCETVCPVNATVHTEDGLNAMAYNRCIGTRYCANNCPYKARRFNFFDYNKRPRDEFYRGPFSTREKTGVHESLKLQKNPNVTVRMRGVMEKCTYCVQRIQTAKIAQKRVARGSADLQVPTGSVRTACQDACPAGAIEFGNLLNPDEAVTHKKAIGRSYDLLSYVGTRPRTSYLARIKNPNPAIGPDRGVGRISEHSHA